MTRSIRSSHIVDTILAGQQSRRGFLRRSIGVGLTASLAGTLLAACGGDDDDEEVDDATEEGSSEDAETGGEPTETEAAQTTAAEADSTDADATAPEADPADDATDDETGTGSQGGVVTLVEAADPASWDLSKSTWPTWAGIHFIYDTLIAFDDEEQVLPQLAESWEISDDGLEYTLVLRDDVTFHEGNPFNADAVQFNVQRHLDLPDSAFYSDFEPVEEMEVIDESTITIRLSEGRFDFLYTLGTWGTAQISPAAYGEDGDGYAENPVGTGPFRFQSYEPGSSIEYVRNEDYWNGAPLLDGVIVRIIPEPAVQVIEMEAGTVDVINVQPQDVDRLEAAGNIIERRVTPGAQFISLNLSEEPTSELAIRKAIAHSIDRDTIIEEVLYGFAEKSQAGVNSNSPYYTEEVPMIEYDPEEAARLLDEAGWVMGDNGIRERDGTALSLNFVSSAFSTYGFFNEIIEDQLRQMGFDSEIDTLEWNAYLDQWRENQGDWNITYHSQGSQLASTAAIQASWEPNSFWTITQIDDATEPELVELGEELQAIADEFTITIDLEARKELATQAQKLFQEHQLTVWLWHSAGGDAINPRLKGYGYSFAGRIIELDKAWVE